MRIVTYRVIVAALSCALTTAQLVHSSNEYSFMPVDSNLGLSSSNVKCILEDSYGFVWFGTKNGLNRYDGVGIKQFDCYDYKESKGNNNISALYEDENKNLWVGTDRGVYIYNPVADDFTFLDLYDKKSGTHAENWVESITGDGKGNVWILLPDNGVFRFHNGIVNNFTIVPTIGNKKEDRVPAICVDSNGDVWAATSRASLCKYNSATNCFHDIVFADDEGLDGQPISLLVEDTDGSLLMSTQSGRVLRLSHSDNTLSEISFSGANGVYVRSLLCFDEEIWIGTQKGLYIISKSDGSEVLLHSDPLNPYSLSDDVIYSLYKSRSDDAWIGTMYGGANYMPRKKFRFHNIGTWTGLKGRVVNGIIQSAEGEILIGTEDAGIFCFDPSSGKVKTVTNATTQEDRMLLLREFNGDIFAGFSKAGLMKIDRGGTMRTYFAEMREKDKSVYSYLKDSYGNEWVGLAYALYKRDAESHKFVRINETGYDWIFSIYEAQDGIIWIATMGNGLWKYMPSIGKYKKYEYSEGSDNGLRSNCISSFMEDHYGNLWISTDRGGLSRYNKGEDNFTTYGIKDGLPDDVVYSVLEDDAGRLWFGTNKGIVKFNPSTLEIRTFTTKDGLFNNQFNYNSALKANDGTFYFGGIGGAVSFNPNIEEYDSPLNPVMFTKLSLMGKEITPYSDNSLLSKSIMFTQKLELPYDMTSFSLEMISPGVSVGRQVNYFYKIEPGNHSWLPMKDNNISFANLPPGTYELSIKAQSSGQAESNSIQIVILPPWWQSKWAYLAYALLVVLVGALCFLWYRIYKERELRKQQQLFTISKENELYRSKVDFFTSVAHEIRTPLTLIAAPLEAMEEIGSSDSRISHYIKVSQQNTQRLLDLTNQLLDIQKVDSNNMTLTCENLEICEFVKDIVSRFESAILLKGKRVRYDIPNIQIIMASDKEALTKIMSNLLSNAMKFSEKLIEVSLRATESDVSISVTSDGEKIVGPDRHRIFEMFYQVDKSSHGENGTGIGLPLSLSLSKLLGGNLILVDDRDNCNTFVLQIPRNMGRVKQNNELLADAEQENLEGWTPDQLNESQDGYTVLIVEDNDGMREFLVEQISIHFSVETATNGKTALDKLAEKSVDLILTDVMMPTMDGFELCKAIKDDINISHIPVIFLTAKNDLTSKVKGLEYGAEAFVEKPFSIKYLIQLMNSLIENRLREREAFSRRPFFNVDRMHLTKADQEFVDRLTKVIEENISNEVFNVEILADNMCTSYSTLLRKIKVIFNASPVELIRIVRLKKAAELINEGSYLIGDICYMVGISSPSYFSKMFFKQFGITPKDFEKSCRKRDK